MPEKKNQHFVPQFYLRNFSLNADGKSIGVWAIDSGKYVPCAGVRNQSCSDYFYGADLKMENALEELDTITAKVISEIINGRSVPPRQSKEFLVLLGFVVSLSLRTRYRAEAVNEMGDRMFKIAYKDDPSVSRILDRVTMSTKGAPLLALASLESSLVVSLDLGHKLLLNNTKHAFITSDNPVVRHNQYLKKAAPGHSHIGFGKIGLQVLLPLDPFVCLILYDHDVYGVGNRNDSLISISNPADVDEINRFQYLNADKALYFNRDVQENYLRTLISDSQRFRTLSKLETDEYELPGSRPDTKSSIIHVRPPASRKDVNLSFIRVLKKAKRHESENIRALYRNPQLVKDIIDGHQAESVNLHHL